MTESELAKDKLKYWSLIERAKKVNFKIPDHWLKYGYGPRNSTDAVVTVINSISDKIEDLFKRDSGFYKRFVK